MDDNMQRPLIVRSMLKHLAEFGDAGRFSLSGVQVAELVEYLQEMERRALRGESLQQTYRRLRANGHLHTNEGQAELDRLTR